MDLGQSQSAQCSIRSGSLWRSVDPYLPQDTQTLIRDEGQLDNLRLPEKIIQALYDCGYFRMVIPKHMGGGGANIRDACTVQRELGYLYPSLGIATTMHLFTIGMIVEHWLRKKDMSWMLLQAISESNAIVASAFAEPGLGGCLVRSNTKAVPVQGGYHLTGVKIPCSFAARSRFFCLHAQVNDEDMIVGLLPNNTPGIQIKSGPPFMGMCSSESDTLILENCFLPNQLIMHHSKPGTDDSGIFKASLIWFCLASTAVYLGATQKVLELAREKLNVLTLPASGSRKIIRADLAQIQTQFGEIYSQFLGLDTALVGLLEILANSPSVDVGVLPQALALKQNSIRLIPQMNSKIMELCGGSTYSLSDPINRLMRDIQAIHFHPPTPVWVDKILGQFALKDRLDFDFIEVGL